MKVNDQRKMAIAAIVFIMVVGGGWIVGYWRHAPAVVQHATTQASDQQTADASTPANAAADNALCRIIDTGRRDLFSLSQRSNAESNPLKRDTLEQTYRQRADQFANDLTNFVSNNEIQDYVGVVSELSMQEYNSGPGIILGIDIPCNATISFQFVTTNPGWGSPDNSNVAIERWRPTLENLAVKDTVTFSGKFFLSQGRFFGSILGAALSNKIGFEGRITDLRKGLRTGKSSAAVPPLTRNESIRIAERDHALPVGASVQMIQNVAIGEGSSQNWQEYVAKIEGFKSVLERHGFLVSGFDHSNTYYYFVTGTIAPPPSAQKWVTGRFATPDKQGYTVKLLERTDTTVLSFNVNGDRASATYSTALAGCTVFCELWKDVRSLPPDVGAAVFLNYNSAASDLSATNVRTVSFSWDPQLGWHVQQ